MADEASKDEEAARLRQAAQEVLKDPVFARAPQLSKLLQFLVEKTVSGEADALKSFTIAVEGLDKRPDDNPDAYARVQIGRLRTALHAYYARSDASGRDRLHLRPGSYRIDLEPAASAEQEVPPPDPPAIDSQIAPPLPARSRQGAYALWVVALAVIAGAAFLYFWLQARAEARRWETIDLPVVALKVTDRPSAAVDDERLAKLRQYLVSKLMPYEGLKLVDRPSKQANFALDVSVEGSPDRPLTNVTLTEQTGGTVIWTRAFGIGGQSDEDLQKLSGTIAFFAGHTTGAIHSYNRERSRAPDSAYRCWLRFTGLVEVGATVGDERLQECAATWHRHAAQNPMAAMLRGWTLTDKSLFQPSEAMRKETLDEALVILEEAKTLNPRSVALQVAYMRAEGFAGNRDEVIAAGRRALELNPDSPHVQALVGMMFSLWNRPEGPRLLSKAIAGRGVAPAWYHIGLCVDAMMRNDRAAERREIAALSPIHKDQAFLTLLFAAHLAREGRVAAAHALLDRPPFRTTFGGSRVGMAIDRLPVAPAVRASLRKSLEPALADAP